MICAGYVPVLAIYWTQWHPGLPPGAIPWILGSGVLSKDDILDVLRDALSEAGFTGVAANAANTRDLLRRWADVMDARAFATQGTEGTVLMVRALAAGSQGRCTHRRQAIR